MLPKEVRPITYKKIAELAGVSLSTVSKALSGNPEISPHTAERIRRLAELNGAIRPKYRRGRSHLRIGIIVPEIVSVYYSTIVTAITAELRRQTIEPCIYITDFDDRRFCRIIDQLAEDGAADGLLLLDEDKFRQHPDIPIVSFCESKPRLRYDTVGVNMYTGIYEAMEYLHSLGHERIGFISEAHTFSKLEMFRSAAVAIGLSVDPSLIFVSRRRFEMIGVEAAEYYLKQESLPTALIAAYDEVAQGAIHTFISHGVRIPEDISVIGINDIPSASYSTVPLTTIKTFSNELIYTAVKLLLEQIECPEEHAVQHISFRCKLIVRETTAEPRAMLPEDKPEAVLSDRP